MSIKKKKSQKKAEIGNIFSENQVMTLLENMNDGIEIIAENQTGLRGDFDDFKEEMTEFKEEMTEFKGEMMSFREETERNFREVFTRLDTIEEDLNNIKVDLKKMNKNKVDRFEFEELAKRIKKIEKEIEKQKKVKVKTKTKEISLVK